MQNRIVLLCFINGIVFVSFQISLQRSVGLVLEIPSARLEFLVGHYVIGPTRYV